MTAWEERQQLHNQNRLEQWRTWSQPSLDIDISPPTDQEADGWDDIIDVVLDFDSLEDYMNITSRGGSDLSFTGPPDSLFLSFTFDLTAEVLSIDDRLGKSP